MSLKNHFECFYKHSRNYNDIEYRVSEIDRLNRTQVILDRVIGSNDLILDIGCGTANFTIRQVGKCKKIIGIDFSEYVINSNNERYKDFKDNIEFNWGKLPKLEYESNKFNVILALEVLYYLERNDQVKAIGEIYRCLKNGGHLIISTVVDKKLRHSFTIEEIRNLLEPNFDIILIDYTYRTLFRRLEQSLDIFDKLCNASINPSFRHDILEKVDDVVLKKILAFIILSKKLSHVYYFLLKWSHLLKPKISYSWKFMIFCDKLTKSLLGEKGITRAIILAKGKQVIIC